MQIQFCPTDLGYTWCESKDEWLRLHYPEEKYGEYRPQPWNDPDCYPFWFKELAVLNNPTGADHAMISYIYLHEVDVIED